MELILQAECESTKTAPVTSQDPVLRAANRIQAMSPLRRALLAREALIAAAGKAVDFGPREALLRRYLFWTGRIGMVTASLILLAKRYVAGSKLTSENNAPDALFIGIDAIREAELREDVKVQLGFAPHFVDQRTPHGFAGLRQPGLGRVLQHWLGATLEALAILSEPDPDFTRDDLLSTLTMRIHDLAYLCAFFEKLHDHRSEMPVICSTADVPAHAACLAGFSVEYHQHGFLDRAIVYPSFSVMVALTAFEGRYVAERVPNLAVKFKKQSNARAINSKLLVVAGDYLDRDSLSVTSLVQWAIANGFYVVVRPHPRGYDELWNGVRHLENVTLETTGRFEDFLDKWRPAFVASWFSTTLLDGLLTGAVPITLPSDNYAPLFPLREIALSWPDDECLIKNCVLSPEERRRVRDKFMEFLQQ